MNVLKLLQQKKQLMKLKMSQLRIKGILSLLQVYGYNLQKQMYIYMIL